MKKIFVLIFAVLTALPVFAWKDLDYSFPGNWIVCETEKTGTSFDVFYLYPTLSANKNRIFLDPEDAKTMAKVKAFVKAQTGIFAADARIFVPLVRQLEYARILGYIKNQSDADGFQKGVFDTLNAFRYYREHFRNGRPFILIGHSQGAMELYELLKADAGISAENGFVAAYLIGMRLTTEKMEADFKKRIVPAESEDDIGVIIVWNTQSKDAEDPLFTGKGGYCINPLNWKTDGTPASAAENQGAFFYDYRNGKTRSVPHFCGARVDTEKGVRIADLPSDSEWDAHGFIGKGVFHMNDLWFFAENTRRNMLCRIERYLRQNERKK